MRCFVLIGLLLASFPSQAAEWESLGPCSKNTPLVFSEILFAPPVRTDGKDLEFVEIYNSAVFPVEAGGYRLSGDIDFTFPAGFQIGAGQFAVIARSPRDVGLAAGLTNVAGPYTGSLGDREGVVRLRNRSDALLLEVHYDAKESWPLPAFHTGRSLVLARPSRGERTASAWTYSRSAGGTPGSDEIRTPSPYDAIRVNELCLDPGEGGFPFIEFFNGGKNPLNLVNCRLIDGSGNTAVVSTSLALLPGGRALWSLEGLPFILDPGGGVLFFADPEGSRIFETFSYRGAPSGQSEGRSPDATGLIHRLAVPTPGQTNSRPISSPVVISEVLFHSIHQTDDAQFIEISNPTPSPVALSGWRIAGGAEFVFPEGSAVAAGESLVVVRNRNYFLEAYPSVPAAKIAGEFGKSIGHGGDRLRLEQRGEASARTPQKTRILSPAWLEMETVRIGPGEAWGKWSDGGGSSLERINLRESADNPDNWADSDETHKSQWTWVEKTGMLDLGNGDMDGLQIFLRGAGECLVDDVEVLGPLGGPDNGRLGAVRGNLVSNPGFSSGIEGWFAQGTHETSRWEPADGHAAAGSLRLVALEEGDQAINRIRTAFTSLLAAGQPNVGAAYPGSLLPAGVSPQVGSIRGWARWLKGDADILFRLNGNYLDAPARLQVPRNLGTPGAPNSRSAAAPPFSIVRVSHAPLLPAAGEAVRIEAQLRGTERPQSVKVRYRIDPSTNMAEVELKDDGRDPDTAAGDSIFTGLLPGQADGKLIAFQVVSFQSADATAAFPPEPGREALIRFGESAVPGRLPQFKVWVNETNMNRWRTREKLSNRPLDATVVIGTNRVIYRAGIYYAGSPARIEMIDSPTGVPGDYKMVFPADEPLFGELDGHFQVPGLTTTPDDTAQREQTVFWIAEMLRVPFLQRQHLILHINGVRRASVYHLTQRPGNSYLDSWFPGKSGGDLYNVQMWYEFTDDGKQEGLFAVGATFQDFFSANGTRKQERYRWNWQKKSTSDPHDYRTLYAMLAALNQADAASYARDIEEQLDIEEWARVWAVERIVGNWDSLGYQFGHNMYAYREPGGRWKLIPWDVDISLGGNLSNAPDTELFTVSDATVIDRTVQRLHDHPPFLRAYWRALRDAVNGPLKSSLVSPGLTARFNGLTANGAMIASPEAVATWIETRRNYILQQFASVDVPLAITTNGGSDFSTNQNLVTLQGTAPIEDAALAVNGRVQKVTWTSATKWQMEVVLKAGINSLQLQGVDAEGGFISGSSAAINITFNGIDAAAPGQVLISELMYHPFAKGGEFIELQNRSATAWFDISGWAIDGVGFTFPRGTILAPGGFVVAVQDREKFREAYGEDLPVAGTYPGRLETSGETIRLLRPVNATQEVVDEVAYSPRFPWPALADGAGSSLQLIDPGNDNGRSANWQAVEPSVDWQQVTVTGKDIGASEVFIYLETDGEVILDDVTLVAGPVAEAGENLLRNGGFESSLQEWKAAGNHSHSSILASPKRSGNSALKLVSTGRGTGRENGLIQTLPSLVAGAPYTLSFWYRPSARGGRLTARFSGNDLIQSVRISGPAAQAPFTPGRPNSQTSALAPFPDLWISEVLPENRGGARDRFGENDPWIELINAGTNTLSLSGLALSNKTNDLAAWPFPPGVSLAAGQRLVVWADGQPNQSSNPELHANFKLTAGSGVVVLTRVEASGARVLDALFYDRLGPDQSFGNYPDASPHFRQVFHSPTAGETNNPAFPAVRINEWMADNQTTLKNPDGGSFDDWLELYNPNPFEVNLQDSGITDHDDRPFQFRFPPGARIPAHGFLVVWADERKGDGDPGGLHLPFRLSSSGERLLLTSPAGKKIDSVIFGAQDTDRSSGRFPDGSESQVLLSHPTPGAANQLAASAPQITAVSWNPAAGVTIEWRAETGSRYRVEASPSLKAGTWAPIAQITADTTVGRFTDPAPGTIRFYRIVKTE